MSLLSSLLSAYDTSIKLNLVDQHDSENTILLPLYHTSLKSDGANIIQASLNKDGTLFKAEFLPPDETIIFPVTNESISRSGKNPPSHPLVDKLSYISKMDDELHQMYIKEFNNWYKQVNDEEIKDYLSIIHNFLTHEDFLHVLLESVYGKYSLDGLKGEYTEVNNTNKETTKGFDLSKMYLTFSINDFFHLKNISVTDFIDLHKNYIQYVEKQNKTTGICNISGEEQQITSKHRGLMGNAKLISVSNNTETYIGRFKKGSDIFQVGHKTSEKIHLMLKYFLENKNSRKWLGGQQYLINWFSDDIQNESQLDLAVPKNPMAMFSESENQSTIHAPTSRMNREVGNSFIKGKKRFEDDGNYYAAIIDKASNGRISLKFFRQLKTSNLLKNLNKWEANYSWQQYNKELKDVVIVTPTLNQIVFASYGIERDNHLVLDNDNFKKDQFQKLIINLIDGKAIPNNLVKSLDLNIRKRLNYKTNWNQVLHVALAVLNNINGEGLQPVLDRENSDRSYLYGRLLAVLEQMEAATYNSDDRRVTNAQKFWTSYTNQPATTMQTLIDKTKHYEKNMMQSKPGMYIRLEKEKNEIINKINEHYLNSKELNKSLDYHFIFGYYAENQYLFTKTDKKEVGEETHA